MNPASKLITIPELIEKAKSAGFDFGVGKPAHLIHHYVQIGLLPKAVRAKPSGVVGHTVGCYPEDTIETLLKIQNLRNQGMSVTEIRVQLLEKPKPEVTTPYKPRYVYVPTNYRKIGALFTFGLILGIFSIAGLTYSVNAIRGNKYSEPSRRVRIDSNPKVLAATAVSGYLEINADASFSGTLDVTSLNINGVNINIDQSLTRTSSPTFNSITIGGVKLDNTTVLAGASQTLTNKSLSGSSNTFSNIPTSAITGLSDLKITVTAGDNLTGGGVAKLGDSVTLGLADDVSIDGSFRPPITKTTTPSMGNVIYNTDTNSLNVYNGTAWSAIGGVAYWSALQDPNGDATMNMGTYKTTWQWSSGGKMIFNGTGVNTALIVDNIDGDLIAASSSGVNKFLLTKSGDLTVAGSIYASNFYVGTGGTAGFLQRQNGAIMPANITDSLLIGATATSSALFSVEGTTGDVIVNGYIKSNLTPIQGSLYDLGTNTRHWRTIYADNIVGAISGDVDITGTTSNDWRINTNNATTDAEDTTITFERGLPAVNAELRWNSGTKSYLSTNVPFLISPDTGIPDAGHAALIVNQTFNEDIFSASLSGVTKFLIDKNGNVGIGTTNATAKLSIGGATSIISNSSGDMTIAPAANLIISTTGNVGIGTTSPGAMLEINTSAAATKGLILKNYLNQTANLQEWQDSSGTAKITIDNNESFTMVADNSRGYTFNGGAGMYGYTSGGLGIKSGGWVWGFSSNAISLNSTQTYFTTSAGGISSYLTLYGSNNGFATLSADGSSGYVSFKTNGSEKMRIDSSGNVGIGTTSPTQKFDVNNFFVVDSANSRVGIGTTAPLTKLQISGDSGLIVDTDRSAYSELPSGVWLSSKATSISITSQYNPIDTNGKIVLGYRRIADNAILSALEVQNIATAGTYSNLLLMKSGGNVGIGTTNPFAKLDVLSTSGAQQRLSYNSSNYANFTVDSAGSLTIGTAGTTGDIILSPYGSGSPTFLSDTGYIVFGGNNNTNNEDLQFDFETTADTIGLSSSTGVTGFSFGSFNIGINNSTPANKLSISSATTADSLADVLIGTSAITQKGLVIQGKSGQTANLFEVQNSTGAIVAKISSLGTAPIASFSGRTSFAGLVVDNSLGDLFTASSSGLNRFVITQNGNVGIGTTNPSALFSVGSSSQFTVDSSGNAGTTGNINLFGQGGSYINLRGTPINAYGAYGLQYDSGSDSVRLFTYAGRKLSIGSYNVSGTSLTSYTSRLYLDDSTGYIGIGTTSPLNTFDVRGNSGITPVASISGQTAFAAMVVDNKGVGDIFTASSSGLTRFVITQNGNVGIGTTSPNASLHIKGPNSGYITYMTNANGSVGLAIDGAQLQAQFYGGSVLTSIPEITFVNDTTTGFYHGTTGHLGITTGGIERLTVNSSGSIGIGTTSPLSTLDVRGNSGITPVASISGQTAFAAMVVDNKGVGDIFTASSSGLTRFVITQNGNVGIGTTSPSALLDVNSLFTVDTAQINFNVPVAFNTPGDLSLSSDLIFTNSTLSNITSNASLAIYAGLNYNSDNITLGTYNAGNVIIDSQAFLTNYSATISGQLIVGASVAPANIGNFYLTNNATYGKALAILNQTESQDIFTASASGVSKFVITNAGNVGIGTTNPTTPLEVNGISTLKNYSIYYSSGTMSGYVGGGNLVAKNNNDMALRSQSSIYFSTNDWSNIPMSIIGNTVGIGTTSPIATLDVRGNSGITPVASISGQTAFAAMVVDNKGVGDIFTASSSGLNRFVITQNGNVGIGTASPVYKLDVRAPTGGILNLYNTTRNHQWTVLTSGIDNDDLVFQDGSGFNALQLKTTGDVKVAGTALYAIYNGSVGIGTTVPLATFDVRGNTGTTPVASISGNTIQAALIVDNSHGSGDLFTASNSGNKKFVIANTGDVTIYGSATTCVIGNGTSGTSCSSDIRLKENINNLGSTLDKVINLQPVTFNWKNGTTVNTGLIAQDVQKIFPELVHQVGNTGYLGIDYAGLTVPLIQATKDISEQLKDIPQIKSDIALLKEEMASASARLTKVETDVSLRGGSIATDAAIFSCKGADCFVALAPRNDMNIATLSADIAKFNESLTVLGKTQLSETSIGGNLNVGFLHFDDIKAEISSLTGLVTVKGTLKVEKGLILQDQDTGEDYCVQVKSGEIVKKRGNCQ